MSFIRPTDRPRKNKHFKSSLFIHVQKAPVKFTLTARQKQEFLDQSRYANDPST